MTLDTAATSALTRDPCWILDCQHDVYSQQGEDGVIEAVLGLLPDRDEWCVEFGAWDGIHYTNTRNLIESANYSAVLIEGDSSKHKELESNYVDKPNIHTMCEFVGSSGPASLDSLLARTAIPETFDFLSIDIDGNDFYVWEGLKKYAPKAVIIEFNPTIPTHVEFVQPEDPGTTQGCSLLALVELGRRKGYELVCVMKWNAIFVRREYFSLYKISCNEPAVLRRDNDMVTYLFSGYDGEIFLHGYRRLPWHQIDLHDEHFQRLPRYLRKFQGNYSRVERFFFNLYVKLIGGKNSRRTRSKRNAK